MKSNKIKTNWLLILILTFHVSSSEASHDEALRILIVGIRGQSRFSVTDLLSGRKDCGQEDREIVKTPVITDEGRKMMLVTGPNLCEEDTARQTFTTVLSLSSPGPHAVLMVLNLEDQQSQQCDIVKRAQELLGAEVLQYCIVLLLQNHQKHFTEASRGIAGKLNHAFRGRFLLISDSEKKPAQTAALVEEIDKLVWLNGDRFYSVLKQKLETEKASQDVHKESMLLVVIYESLVGAVGIAVWICLVYPHRRNTDFNFKVFVHVIILLNLRYFLRPEVAIPLNLALITSLTDVPGAVKKGQSMSNLSNNSINNVVFDLIYSAFFKYLETIIMYFMFWMGSALFLGTIISIRTWSDVLIACYAAPGVTFGALVLIADKNISHGSPEFMFRSSLFCSVGAALSVGFVSMLSPLLDVKMTIFLLILGFTMVCVHLISGILENVFWFIVIIVVFPCVCVLIGSVFLIIKVAIEILLSSFLFHVVLLIGSLIVMYQWLTASD